MPGDLTKKELHSLPLAFIAISTILGSGWLLAPAFVFSTAGTYSIYAWLIGCLIIFSIALCFAEVCSMIPRDGSTVILPRITHGYLVSCMYGFLSWLSWLALVPIEAQASIQYLSHFYPSLVYANNSLTPYGVLTALALIISITVINYFSLKWVDLLNRYVFIIIKIGVPVLVAFYGIYISLQIPTGKVIHHHSFSGLFAAIPLGIVFAFNGFKSVCESAGRAKNPKHAIPFSIIVSLLLCLIVYLLLQLAFNANATLSLMDNKTSPFANMIYNTKTPFANLLVFILYIGAVVSPYAANIFNLSSSNSCVYRVAKFNYIPGFFKSENKFKRYSVALIANSIIALGIVLLLNQGWGEMVNNLTSIMVVTYTIGPLCLLSLRYQHREFVRTFKLPFGVIISIIAFIMANYMIYWCGWNAIKYFLGAVIIGGVFFVLYGLLKRKKIQFDFYNSHWMWAWFIGIGIISYYGSYGHGRGVLSGITALIVLTLFSLAILYWNFITRLSPEQSSEELAQLHEEPILIKTP